LAITTHLTIVGNLTADPELKYTTNGKAVVNLTIASTPRNLNRQTNEWEDGETTFMRASAFDELAENIADSFSKGNRVFAVGVMKTRKYQTREGADRESTELMIDEIGPSLKYATAKPEKRGRTRNTAQPPTPSAAVPGRDADGWVTVDDDIPF
jgi:single-strand DNA-binding protein